MPADELTSRRGHAGHDSYPALLDRRYRAQRELDEAVAIMNADAHLMNSRLPGMAAARTSTSGADSRSVATNRPCTSVASLLKPPMVDNGRTLGGLSEWSTKWYGDVSYPAPRGTPTR